MCSTCWYIFKFCKCSIKHLQNILEVVTCKIKHMNIFCKCFILHVTMVLAQPDSTEPQVRWGKGIHSISVSRQHQRNCDMKWYGHVLVIFQQRKYGSPIFDWRAVSAHMLTRCRSISCFWRDSRFFLLSHLPPQSHKFIGCDDWGLGPQILGALRL